jgi:hypothetical protein
MFYFFKINGRLKNVYLVASKHSIGKLKAVNNYYRHIINMFIIKSQILRRYDLFLF